MYEWRSLTVYQQLTKDDLCLRFEFETLCSYVISNSGPATIYSSMAFNEILVNVNKEHNLPHLTSSDLENEKSLQDDVFVWSKDEPSLMIYTSGTTGRPKGAVHTAGSLTAMVKMLHAGWNYSQDSESSDLNQLGPVISYI